MPRSSSKVAPAPRMFNPTPTKVRTTTVPTTVAAVPEKPTFGQAMKEGFGFGFGQAAAHSIFRSIFGSGQSSGQPTSTTGATAVSPSQLTSYQQCLKESNNDIEGCKYLDSSD